MGGPGPRHLPQAGCGGNTPRGEGEGRWEEPLPGRGAGTKPLRGARGRLVLPRDVAAQSCAGGRRRRLTVALPPPLGLGLGDTAGFGGPAGDVPGGSRSVCPLTERGGGRLRTRCHARQRCLLLEVFAAGRAVAWPGQHCDARGHFGSPEPHELQQRSHWAAPVGFGADFGHWDVIIGVRAGDSAGCSSSLGDGVGGAGAAPCTLPEVAGGRSATLAMQEKEISRSRMTPRSWAATSPSLPSLSPSTGRPAPVPPCRGAACGQGAGTGWAAVPAPGSREPRNLSAYKSLIS